MFLAIRLYFPQSSENCTLKLDKSSRDNACEAPL